MSTDLAACYCGDPDPEHLLCADFCARCFAAEGECECYRGDAPSTYRVDTLTADLLWGIDDGAAEVAEQIRRRGYVAGSVLA